MKQREIKFRVWYKGAEYPLDKNDLDDHEKPQMIYNVQLLYDGMGVDKNSVLGGYSCFGSLLNEDQFNVMQFTGLLDKNGREIYEGDIDNFGWIVCFEHGVFCLKERLEAKTFIAIHESNIHEIIGNIYENPELLK